jgi:hypothetical protein
VPPLFRHGRNTKVLFNKSDLSQYLSSVTISASMDAADATTFGNFDKKYIPGMRDTTLSFDGLFSFSTVAAGAGGPPGSSEIDAVLAPLLGSSTRNVITVGPEGDSTGRRAYFMNVDNTAYNVEAAAADIVGVSMDMQGSENIGRGVWLKPLGAITSTGVGGGVDSGIAAGTTGGGSAVLHATNVNSTGVLTVKVQHSSNNTAWTDLITFTALSTAGVQRSTVAGTIKRYMRYTTSGFTGGTKSATLAVAAARHGKIRM